MVQGEVRTQFTIDMYSERNLEVLKRASIRLITTILMTFPATAYSANRLSIGDLAPALTTGKFVKGVPVTKFDKGKLYVVEFWATWCGPCKISIPHLTQLQKKFKEVTIIGVSVLEESQAGVEPFVKKMGAQMDYHVALDSIPPGQDKYHGVMAVNWLRAAAQNGIPTAFIIDKASRIAWIGHPLAMEAPLAQVVAGTWDAKREAVKIAQQQAGAQKVRELYMAINAAYGSKNYLRVLALVNAAISRNARLEPQLSYVKFTALVKLNRPADAAAYGNKLAAGIFHRNAQTLNQMARGIVDPAGPKSPAPLVDMAQKAATRADEISLGKDAAIIDTLAAAYFAAGNTNKAFQTEERALRAAKGTRLERNPEFAQHLAMFKPR